MGKKGLHAFLMSKSYMLSFTPLILKPSQTEMTLSLLILTMNLFKMSPGGRSKGEFSLAEKTPPSVVNPVQPYIVLKCQI